MFEDNCSNGALLETFVSNIVKKQYSVIPHEVWERGLDLKTSNNEIASEMLNWYGGFIHSERFRKIVDNLVVLGSKAKHKLFICAGVKPTKHQTQLMKAYNIKVIQLPDKEHSSKWKKTLTNRLLEEGVITYSTYSALTESKSDCLPVTVMIAEDIEGNNPHEVWSFVVLRDLRPNLETGWIDQMSKKKSASLNEPIAIAYMDEYGGVSYFETTIAKLFGVKS